MNKTILARCIPLAALCASPAAAQQEQGQANPLEEIVVTATRMDHTLANAPVAVSVIGEQDIQSARQQLGLDESLSRVPGLFMQNRYNFAQDLRIAIRGFGARANFGIRGIKILVDGIPETLPDGQGSVDTIDIGATSQIEVIRGPTSTLYGNASGGVISVTSEAAPDAPFVETRLSGGEYGFRKIQLKAGGRTDRVGYMLSASDQEFDGYREQSRAENRQLTGRFDIDLGSEREFRAVINHSDQPVADDPGGVDAEQAAAAPRSARDANVLFNGGETLEQTRIGFLYAAPIGSAGLLEARNYYVTRDFSNSLPFTGGGIVEFDRFFAGGGVSYTHEGVWLDRPNRLIVGLDYEDQDDDRLRYDNLTGTRGPLVFDQNESVTSQGLFIRNELSLTPDASLTFGARFDEVEFDVTDHFLADGDDSGSRSLRDTSPMIALSVGLSDSLRVYGRYSTAFETPTTTEFNRPSGAGGFNPNVDPQTAENLEVGMRGILGERSRYELALYTIDVDDELIAFEVPGSPGRDFYENAGSSKRDGLEASLILDPTERLSTTFTYTYSDFEFERFVDGGGNDFSGNTIPATSEHVLFGEVTYTDPRGWFGAFDVMYVDDQFANNANTDTADGYTVANARFGYERELGGIVLEPFVGVNNLFDETYMSNVRINAFGGRYFEAAPDRNVYGGVTIRHDFR